MPSAPPPLADIARNPLKEKLARGDLVASMTVRMARGPEIGRIAATAGFDTLYIDLEHSALSLETTALVCTVAREAGVVPLVRVPALDAALIGRVLDVGAMGIIAPQIQSAADAQRAVSCCRYPPQGERSIATGLPLLHHRSFPAPEACAALNAAVFVAVMIETPHALAHAGAIAAVDGIDMLFVGAQDLAGAMGWPDAERDAALEAAFDQVLAAAQPHGKTVGAGGVAGKPALLQRLVSQGVRYISTGTDLSFLLSAATQRARAVHGMRP